MTNHLSSYKDLFEAVQLQQIFPDGKTFADCIAKMPVAQIEAAYLKDKDKPGFNLMAFVEAHFEAPVPPQQHYQAREPDVAAHINNLWQILTRSADTASDKSSSSLIPLPYPYIVPGGRFGEIYYWDSYFTMLGLQSAGKVEMIEHMVNNFSFLIDKVGYIPNGNRTYFLGRSQPPFYALMIRLLAAERGEAVLIKYLSQLEKEYAFWMKGSESLNATNTTTRHVVRMPDGSVLNRYWDEHDTPRPESYRQDIELAAHATDKPALYRHIRAAAESGWDFSCRWFKEAHNFTTIHAADIVPVDLNCLLFYLEQTLAAAYSLKGDETNHALLNNKAAERKKSIQRYCWNESGLFYYDYDVVTNTQKKIQTIAAAFPLYVKIAGRQQAASVAATIQDKFLQAGGITTTLEVSGQQWDAPNGWAPLQWITIQGLENYGMHAIAKIIAERWIALNEKVYQRTGKLMEKYNVYNTAMDAGGGEYPSQDGFGWTNGVLLKLMAAYKK